MDKKKVLIVGGGVSGLTSGIYAANAGFDVEIYEKHSIVGGECTGWDRDGYHIDNCIHWLMGTTKRTELNKIWETVGAITDDIEVINSDSMYTSELNGEKITLWKDVEKTRKELIELSPDDEEEINKLIEYVKMSTKTEIPAEKPSEFMGLFDAIKMAGSMKDTMKLFKELAGMDTQDLMNRFKHPLIRCMISDFCTKESLAYSFPMSYGNFVGGDGGIPKGGSREFAFRMKRKFEELGGKVFVNSSVERIVIGENEKATGIVLQNGNEVKADYIICACDTSYTFRHLLDKSYMDPMLKEMYDNPETYPIYGMFQVAFAIDSSDNVLPSEIILETKDIQKYDWISNRMTVKTYAYEPSFAPEGKQIMQVLLGLDIKAYDFWKEKYNNKEEYNKQKEDLAISIMKILENRFPEYNGKMRILDIWTPVTYERYCNAYKGYNQSFTITKNSKKNPYPSPYIKGLNNVIISGQWINPPGGLPGAAIQGKFAVQRILKKEGKNIKI